jgi:hypothetical protein
MREVSVWLDSHCTRGDQGVFRSAAQLRDAGVTDEVHAVSSGRELLELGAQLAGDDGPPIDHLVIAGHGGTTWVLDDEHGVTTGAPRRHDQVGVYELTAAWSPSLARLPLVSLAACMCSRSPRWYLEHRLGGRDIGSDWGPRAYQPGGQASLSARLRDALVWHGHSPRVRGHRAAGHATALALLAEHAFPAASPCTPLFALACPGQRPTLRMRRRWVREVTGELAQRWLLGDDSVVAEISRRMS